MSGLAKKLVVGILTPLAAATKVFAEPLRRTWAHACLSVAVKGTVEPSVVILGVPEIQGTGQIIFGKDLFLYRELYLETQGKGHITIGSGVVISRGVHLVSFAEINIGDGVMIGEYTSIRDANHRQQLGQSVRWTGHEAAPVHIKRNVWIGRGVTVLSGVTIGEGAVVGANAVVTQDVAPGAVVVGVPARPLS